MGELPGWNMKGQLKNDTCKQKMTQNSILYVPSFILGFNLLVKSVNLMLFF